MANKIKYSGSYVVSEYVKFGQELKDAIKSQGAIKYASDIGLAKDEGRIQKDRLKTLQELKIKEVGLRKEIELGLNVDRNRASLMKTLQERQDLGVKLSQKAREELRLYNKELTFAEKLKIATDSQRILEERSKKVESLTLKEAELRKEMELGINVDKNRLQVLNMLQSKQEMGIALTDKETKELAEYNNELKKSKAIPTYVENIKNAKDVNRIQKERLATLKSLKVEEVGLRKEIEKGISTDKNRKRLMEILQQRQDLGVTLSKKARIELKAYNAELQRSKTVGTATDLFSPAWFKHRAKWFMELRGLWAAYRGVGDAIRSTLDYQVQLSRAMRTATSIAMDHTETMQHYGQIMRESISTHAADWKDLGEVLYQLGSAGLSAEESMAGLNTTMSLIVGTEGDARETTKSVAGVYNNFKDTLNKVGGAEEKLTYITDLMAAAWKKHQIEINELTDGYAQASAMAKVAGISIEDLTALLAVANDHMIKGGRAGRALTNVWSRMAKTPRAFGEAFGIDIDPHKPIKFMDIMGKIANKFGKTEQSVAALGVAFERLGLRGAPIFEMFIQNWEKVIKTQEDFANISGTAAKLEQERLDNLDGQWKRLVGNLKSYAAQTEGLMRLKER